MNKKGFTIIEVLLVITIIGVLSAIVIPQIKNYSEKHGGVLEATKELGKLKGSINISIKTKDISKEEELSTLKDSTVPIPMGTLECDDLSTVMQNCIYSIEHHQNETWFIPLTCVKGIQGWECTIK